MRALHWLGCCLAVLLLAGCSATRLAYDHLDTLVHWQASDYIDMTGQQRQAFDAELYRLWAWHRGSQLPLYSADLKHLADEVQAGPLSLQQLDDAGTRITEHWNSLIAQALPGYARLHADLSDAQVADMVRRIGKQVERKSRKRQKRSEAERREHSADEMDDLLHDWIGRPNPAQRLLVEQWAAREPGATQEQEQLKDQETQASLEHYAALLATRTQPGFEQRMGAFIQAPEAADERVREEAEQQRWLQLLADISATMEPGQREHLRQRLLDYAADFDALAAEEPPQNPDAAGS